MATKQVKTYRVLRDGMNVGDSVRNFGDLIPEAVHFVNLRSYLNAGVIEEIWVDESVVEDFIKEQEKNKPVEVEANPEVDGADDPEDKGEAKGDSEPETQQPKKRVTKKTPAKKKTVKKTTRKKAESSGKQLEERSV